MQINKKFVLISCLIILFVLPCYSQKRDLLGWQEARWGMSEKELLEIFKSELKKLPKRENFNKWYADYSIPNYEINGRKYIVYFQMDGETNKLSQILVQDFAMKADSSKEIYFNGLEALLTRKYGTPGYTKNDRKSYLISLSRQWVFPTTTIELGYSWMDEIATIITIRYFPTKSGDIEKI